MSISKIACCTDFSENADAAFETAVEMADKYGAQLWVVHVMPPVINPLDVDPLDGGAGSGPIPAESDTWILQLEERMQQVYGSRIPDRVEHRLVVLAGHVSSEILRLVEAEGLDLLVLGSYGLSGMGLVVFGSIAKRVVHKAPCSVMVVRPPKKS